MTECNGCGVCCDPFMMVYSPHDVITMGPRLDAEERAFYDQHLTPIRRADGRRMVAHWSSGWSEIHIPGDGWQMLAAWYYRCDRYDPVARRCTDYENRPDVCRGYPWYGEAPDPNKSLPPTCSYRADVGKAVEPVEVEIELRRKRAVLEESSAK
jgi:Fe-S-cluster containining protein